MNNKYIIKAKHPLLRAGLTIETEASESYVVVVTKKLMNIIREINTEPKIPTCPVCGRSPPGFGKKDGEKK